MNGLKIGGLDCEPGSRTAGWLSCGTYFPNAPKDYIRKMAEVPFSVVCGRTKGPTLCIGAGMDPTEYAGIYASIRLSKEIDPQRLAGNLIFFHVANVPGFWERKYYTTLDQKRLAVEFPGDAGGTVTQSTAYHIFREFILKSDYYIELHGSDVSETMIPFAIFYRVGSEEVDAKSEALARAMGFKYVGGREASAGPELKSGARVANTNGIPSAISEAGEGDVLLEKDVKDHYDAVLNVMRHLKMIGGRSRATREQIVGSRSTMIRASQSGLFISEVKPGDVLEKGGIVGTVVDLHGEQMEVLKAPAKGVVIVMVKNPVVEVRQPVVLVYQLF